MKLNYKDFNEMSAGQLKKLPGVGNTTVARIIAFRPFRSNEDLFKVRGLGKTTLKKFGIQKKKKKKNKWFTIDSVDYPGYAVAADSTYGNIDLFWRIPIERRVPVAPPSEHILKLRRMNEKIRAAGPDAPWSRYVDNSFMFEEGFKFSWEK